LRRKGQKRGATQRQKPPRLKSKKEKEVSTFFADGLKFFRYSIEGVASKKRRLSWPSEPRKGNAGRKRGLDS